MPGKKVDEKKRKGGFHKVQGELWDDAKKRCRHPEHKPPGHIVLQPGTYEYVCPGCGHVTKVHVPLVTW